MIRFRRLTNPVRRRWLANVLRQFRRPGYQHHRTTLIQAKANCDQTLWHWKRVAAAEDEASAKSHAYAQAEAWFELSETVRLAHNTSGRGWSFLLPPGFALLGS